MITVGIESSCDDTAIAVLDDYRILANIVSSQNDIHERFGGIVPELASRTHMACIGVIFDQALQKAGVEKKDLSLVAATRGPGLIGSLLVGFSYAKALSYALDIPFVGVDHMTGHILSAFLESEKPDFPYIALIVSGGTSALYRADSFFDFTLLGRTRDDAAGEAFDKVARLLGLAYPGGPAVSREAEEGRPDQLRLPRAWLEENSLDFSFSGLKTAVLNHCNKCRMKNKEVNTAAVCASFQEAVVEVLVEKTIKAATTQDIRTIVIGGGVAANQHLRASMQKRCREKELDLYLPAPGLCTDNAAMIAFSGMKLFKKGVTGSLNDDVFSRSVLGC